jgi:integrase
MARLTDPNVKRLPVPAKGSKVYYDGETKGFGCRVTAAGARAYILNYVVKGNGRERRLTIGSATDWRATDAREEAKRLRQEIDRGVDPLGDLQDQRAAPTVAQLCDRFEAEHVVRKRPSTASEYRTALRLHVRPFFKLHIKVADVGFEDIDCLHRKITQRAGPYSANRAVAMLSKMFGLAVLWKMRDDNPCRGVERNVEYSRRRYLSGDELARLVQALAEHKDQQAANIIRVLLMTGCRRGEALAMRWADVNLTEGTWSKEPSSTKQKEHHQVPLSAPARQLLADIQAEQAGKRHALPTFVFPGAGSTGHRINVKEDWRQLCQAAGITGLRIHDLRHSFASQLASGGASLPLIGALLGHTQPSTTARYAHLFDDPQRAAVEKVGAVISNAGKPAPAPPVKLRGGGAS